LKKILVLISIFIVFVLIYLLSATFFNWFTIAGIGPNLFIIFALFIGLFMGEIYGVTIGAIMGVILDLIISPIIRNKWYRFGNHWFSGRNAYEVVFKRQQNDHNGYSHGNDNCI